MDQTLPLITILFGVSSGMIFAAAITTAVLSFISLRTTRRLFYFSLSITCLFAIGYQLSTLIYHLSPTVSDAITATKWQINFTLLTMLGIFALCVIYTQQKKAKSWSIILSALIIIVVVINTYSAFSLRFASVSGLHHFQYGGGETFVHLTGSPGVLRSALIVLVSLISAYCIYRLIRHCLKEKSKWAAFTAAYLLIHALAFLYTTTVDSAEFDSIYLYGFSFSLFIILICVQLAYIGIKNASSSFTRKRSLVSAEQQKAEIENQIHRMAYEDPLTGLPNRAMVRKYLNERLHSNSNSISDSPSDSINESIDPLLHLQINIDHFKHINDELGQDAGDQVLQLVARRLTNTVGQTMLVARIAGDEFVLIDEHPDSKLPEYAVRTSKKVLQLINQPVQVGAHSLHIGATISALLVPQHADTAHDVIRTANITLAKGKKSGRGSYHLYNPRAGNAVRQRLKMEQALRKALRHEQFELYFQPLVDTKRICIGAEALIRWNHPEHGIVSPDRFILLAEETGLINPIGDWVISQSLQTLKRLYAQHPLYSGYIAINVSAWQFARPDFVKSLEQAIGVSQIPPNRICIEITESVLLNDLQETIVKLNNLRGFGIRIALDDFGTGYSSLAYLRDLPIDILKIDRSFIHELHQPSPRHLADAIMSIGAHLKIKTVAEGVETESQWQHLRDMGCNIYQGFLFSKPITEDAFTKWLANNPFQTKA